MSDIPRPVSRWENEQVKGLALCVDYLFCEHNKDVKKLRERQAVYNDSLPVEPLDVIRAGLQIIHPPEGNYLEGFEEALHLSHGIEALINSASIDEFGQVRDAATFLATRLTILLGRAQSELDRLSDTLGSRARTRPEAQTRPDGMYDCQSAGG